MSTKQLTKSNSREKFLTMEKAVDKPLNEL